MAPAGDDHGPSEHEREARELGEKQAREADEMERRGEQLDHELHDVRQDWERKRADPSVPGAPPPEDEDPGREP